MHIEITERENAHQGIDPDNSMTVVIDIAFVNAVPVVHLMIIAVKIRCVVLYTENHLKKICRFVPQRIKHHLAVIKILENISSYPVGVIVGVNEVHGDSGQHFQQKNDYDRFYGNTLDMVKPDLEDKKDKQQGV